TTAAAIWQQMMKTNSIAIILRQNKHIKRTAGQILIAQLCDYHIRKAPYNMSYLIYEKWCINLSVENLDAVAQICSYYIANNKFELSCYSVGKSVEDIQKILYDADLYEETDNITFEQAIINANINQTSIDDDNDIVSEEVFKLEKTLDLSNLSFLPDENRQAEADMVDDDALDAESSDWLEEFN
ncbi:3360_t:CDS:2, partial [Cetraspora pellucida]